MSKSITRSVNLEPYLNREVRLTYRNGKTSVATILPNKTIPDTYRTKGDMVDGVYFKNGLNVAFATSGKYIRDIVAISENNHGT